MNSRIGRNDPCPCGSGKKYEKCCGAGEQKTVTVPTKDLTVFELTPGLAVALSASLDPSYTEYLAALDSGAGVEEAKKRIAAIPEDKRYLTRVLDSLDNAFADFDTGTAKLDLPNMHKRNPEAIKHYLEFRLIQLRMLLHAVQDYVENQSPTIRGHS